MDQVKNAAIQTSSNQNAPPNTAENDDDNDSFAQYELESAANSAAPVSLATPISEKPQSVVSQPIKRNDKKQLENEHLQEIITLKNILIETQQQEIDQIKQEVVKGTATYVCMTKFEYEDWKKYKAIDKTFTLVDKLRNTVPPNIKWIDKNVHKVIGNIIKLKELEETIPPK